MIKQANLSVTDEDILREINKVLESGNFINGVYNKLFSRLWAEVCGVQCCIPVSSGNAALRTVLKFYKKKTVTNYAIVPNYSFVATLHSVMAEGYIPIFCPVDSRGLMNQEILLEILKQRQVSAIVPVHLYGQLLKLNLEPIKDLSDAAIIEDACQVHGGLTEVQGDAACFSFYPSKNLGTIGDGGAIVTNHSALYDFSRQYINYGNYPEEKYVHTMQGDNLRLDEIKAAVLCSKLLKNTLSQDNFTREFNAGAYFGQGINSFTQKIDNVYHLYPILFEDRKKSMDIFYLNNIEVGNHYPYTLNGFAEKSYFMFPKDCNAKHIAEHVVTLPIGPHLNEDELRKVVEITHLHFKWDEHYGWFTCKD